MLPPVFVMNPYYSGLGIARSLHGHGINVYALASERDAPGVSSRYFRRVFAVPNGRDEPDRLRERLLQLSAGRAERPILFPTRDFDLLFLHEHSEALSAAYRLPQPANSPILRMMDKFELAAVARDRGIPAPATTLCASAPELKLKVSGLSFPLVMKPRFAYQWRREGSWAKVGAAKAIIVHSEPELRARYHAIADVTPEVLLQEYVAGDDTDIAVCCCYIDRQGKLLGHFTAKKLRQNPPLVGTGSIVEAGDVPAIVPLSIELLKTFDYSGLAEVEFKYDRASERFFLIEINPRHWDQHELGTLVGVNLSWIAYCDMIGLKPEPSSPAYRAGRSCKWIAERELIHGIARNCTISKAVVELRALRKGKKIFGVARLADPITGIELGYRLAGEALKFLRSRMDTEVNIKASQGTRLVNWSREEALAYTREVVHAKHAAHCSPLFEEPALIELLESYPRERLQAFTMGTNPLQRNEWQPVDTEGASGKDIWAAVKRGRLWLNVLNVHRVDRRYRDLIERLYGELREQCPHFRPNSIACTLLLSSPNALVYYHADAQPNLLWQLRGKKRVWVYPANDPALIKQELMEDIFANFADEEVPYASKFDDKATVYELCPGDVISWPQNSPHRVTNIEGVNVSLSTVHETEESDRRKLVYCANRLFRRTYRLPLRSTQEAGFASYLKRLSYRAFYRAGLVETPPRRAYLARFRIDPQSPSGYSAIREAPVLTEFSRKDFRIEKDPAGNVSVVRA
ncbi:MAG: carboxylate--amine ligase [Betaproteobacteria bacterium]